MIVAEDDEMSTVLNCLKSTLFDRAKKPVAPDKPFNIADLPLDHASPAGLGRFKKLRQPDFRAEMIWSLCHGATITIPWLNLA